jgi:argininosuccinate lyase
MKLWEKGIATNQLIEQFTVGKDRELDILLARYDVLGTLAHSTMLEQIGLLETTELAILTKELRNIYTTIEAENFAIEVGVEDIHSQIELLLTRRLGETGKKVHSGRSRNDQVLLDIKLFVRAELQAVGELVKDLFETLLELSENHKNTLLPGYTHLQVAMPSSFGLWFGAYAESLADDMLLLQTAYRIANQNPLGSGAGYGSSFPLDRRLTTDLLNYNVVYAQMGRGKVERIVSYALATIGATLAKMAMDVCLYMSQNFAFLSFPDEYTTGSSIMPHKKNPDVFELIRAKGNKLQALPNEIALLTTNLPSGYYRDLQILKESFLPAFSDLKFCLQIARQVLMEVRVKEGILEEEKYLYLFSVEEVNKQVLAGVPFRDAYKKIAQDIQNGSFQPDTHINHTHEGSIGNLMNEAIRIKMDKVWHAFDFEKVNYALESLLKAS